MTSRRRVVLGVRFGAPVILTWLCLATLLALVALRWLGSPLKGIVGSVVGPIFVSLVSALLFRARWLVGSAVELDEHELRLRPYGYLGFAKRLPLSTVISAAPWGEDEPAAEAQHGERAPRLFIALTDERYELFGPWNTRNADADYQKLRALFGPLFLGDGKLRR